MLRQFVVSYIALMTILFMAISLCSCLLSIWHADRELRKECTTLLEDGKSTIDLQIYSLLNLRIPLVTRDNALAFQDLSRPLPSQVYPGFNELSSRLSSYSMMGNFAEGMTLYYQKSRVFVSSKGVGVYSEAFYNGWLNYYDISYQEWSGLVHGSGQPQIISNYTANTDKEPVLEIVSTLPNANNRTDNPILIFTLKGSTLDRVFEPFRQYGDACFSVTDGAGHVYYANTAPEQLARLDDEKQYLHLKSGSSVLDVAYHVYVPRSAIFRQSVQLLQTYIFIYVVLILLAGLMFWLITYRNTKPLRRIVADISQRQGLSLDGTTCEVDFISGVVTELFDDMEQLEWAIHSNFMEKLLRGIPLTEGEIQSLDSRSMRIFSHDRYAVAVFQIVNVPGDDPRERFAVSSSLQRLMLEQLEIYEEEGAYAHPVDFDKAALILGFHRDCGEPQLEHRLEGISARLAQMNLQTVCAVGDVRSLCDQVYLSFQNACWMLSIAEDAPPQTIRWFRRQLVPMEHYYYPMDIQGRLRNQILEGAVLEAQATLEHLFEQNYRILQLPEQEKARFSEVLCHDLQMTQKSIGPLEEETDRFHYLMTQVKHNPCQKNNLKYYQMIVQILAHSAQERSHKREGDLIRDIQAYIQQGYGAFDMGLAAIAGHFDLNENYLSTLYKQQTGENLSAYVEDCRMQRAVEYVRDDVLSIKDIAEKVGYSNINTFYKAFKRRYGVPPKKYQEQLRMQHTHQTPPPPAP
ncbi:AraC family transcriptional regulator [Ruminococcaceae bacterium OttesenSCG-928-L11]|nr:AraC family transcriptional regulator [Ruminococcaceae bacterium OttesenSCG-928-L11]